ncbi:MAG: nitrile hydratase accessory protein [Rubrivivax sp.]
MNEPFESPRGTVSPSPVCAGGPPPAAADAPMDALPFSALSTAPSPPPFSAPWQAHAFALTLALHERGVFTWPQWAEALSQAIARAQAQGDPDHGDTYYHHWVDALRSLLTSRGLADAAALDGLEAAWMAAADRTPHGQPIELDARAMGHAPHAAPDGRSGLHSTAHTTDTR